MNANQKKSFEYVVNTAMKTLSISRKQAEARVWIIVESGLLGEGGPEDTFSQMMIENFMRFDPDKLDYMELLFASMNFPKLVAAYDKKFNAQMTTVLSDIRGKEILPSSLVKEEIEKFDKFFKENIWSMYPQNKTP